MDGRAHDAALSVQATLSQRPRRTLQRKLVLWTVTLVCVSTLACALWLNELACDLLSSQHQQSAAALSQALSAALAGRIGGGPSDQVTPVLESLDLGRQLAFVVVTDAQSHPVSRHIFDVGAYQTYLSQLPLRQKGPTDLAKPLVLEDGDPLVVYKSAVWDNPTGEGPAAAPAPASRQLQGYLLLGMRERDLNQMIWRLWAGQMAAACIVCLLSLPIVVWAVRRWTWPIRSLLEAILRLGAGEAPTPVPVQSNDELGLLASTFNLMSRKLHVARDQLQRSNAALERKVAVRTAELERLNRKLESEIHDKNEFIRAITHDLGAPLRNITGIAGLLLAKHRERLTDDVLVKLERISANAKVQADLIGDLLEFSRIRTRPGRREVVDLQQLVEQLQDNFADELEKARIQLTIHGPMPNLLIERVRIRQVFQNLLDNAIKYMLDSPQRRITISYRPWGDLHHFCVADTGRGIATEDLPRVFDLFCRATHSGAHHVAGRGVGLSTVKTIVEYYGGRAWVESVFGQGSSFHFTLDRHIVAPPGAAQPSVLLETAAPE